MAVGRIKQLLKRITDRHVLGIPERAENPYATHLPVLIAAARIRPVRRILEFGCGDYSTSTFLNRDFYPDVERLDAYENDAIWGKKVADANRTDTRLNLQLIDTAVAEAAARSRLDDYDLIMVDDSTTEPERIATIQQVAKGQPSTALVVVHDFELKSYRDAGNVFRRRFRFTGLSPNTGVLCNDPAVDLGLLGRVNAVVKKRRHTIRVDDGYGWLHLVKSVSRDKMNE